MRAYAHSNKAPHMCTTHLQVDAAVNACLVPSSQATDAATSDTHRTRVLSFVSDVLQGTSRAPLPGAGTVMLALESPLVAVRMQALQTLDADLLGGEDGPTLREAVLRRMQVRCRDAACLHVGDAMRVVPG